MSERARAQAELAKYAGTQTTGRTAMAELSEKMRIGEAVSEELMSDARALEAERAAYMDTMLRQEERMDKTVVWARKNLPERQYKAIAALLERA